MKDNFICKICAIKTLASSHLL